MIPAAEFQFFCDLVKERSGLVLTKDKAYLIENRLLPVVRHHKLTDLVALIRALKDPANARLVNEVVEAMTTNESFFFRDMKPFDQFRDLVLPHMIKARAAQKTIRIWSAACSSGQEPYSLSILLNEQKPKLEGWRIEILATDLSNEILEKAKAGIYTQFEVQRGLPIQLLIKYFTKVGDRWEIKEPIRKSVNYRVFNLLSDPAPLGRFDVVFCRNVLIYFDSDTKGRVLECIRKLMPDDGFLYLGGAETVFGVSEHFAPVPSHRGVYMSATRGSAVLRAAG